MVFIMITSFRTHAAKVTFHVIAFCDQVLAVCLYPNNVTARHLELAQKV